MTLREFYAAKWKTLLPHERAFSSASEALVSRMSTGEANMGNPISASKAAEVALLRLVFEQGPLLPHEVKKPGVYVHTYYYGSQPLTVLCECVRCTGNPDYWIVYHFGDPSHTKLEELQGLLFGPMRFFLDNSSMTNAVIEREWQDHVAQAEKPANETKPQT